MYTLRFSKLFLVPTFVLMTGSVFGHASKQINVNAVAQGDTNEYQASSIIAKLLKRWGTPGRYKQEKLFCQENDQISICEHMLRTPLKEVLSNERYSSGPITMSPLTGFIDDYLRTFQGVSLSIDEVDSGIITLEDLILFVN